MLFLFMIMANRHNKEFGRLQNHLTKLRIYIIYAFKNKNKVAWYSVKILKI